MSSDTSPFDVSARTARWALAGIVLLAFALRVVYVLQSRESPLFDAPQMDALYHVEWARAFARGEDYQPGPFFRAPLYPWFLGVVFRVCGDDLLVPRLVQAAIGAGSCVLAYGVGARAFDRRTGLLGAAFLATYWIVVYFDGELLLPVLEVPTCLAAILCALRFGERPTSARALVTGVAIGVAALVRPNALVMLPCFGAWFAWSERARLAASVRVASACIAGAALVVAPVTLYNAVGGGDRVLISSQGGVNLWIGNNPASDGSSAIVPGTRQDWWGGYHDAIRQAEIAEGRSLKPSEVSAHYTRRALDFWRDAPAAALRLLWTKVRLFTIDWELGNNQDERFFALRFGPVLRFLPVGFGVVAPLALLGLCASARRIGRVFPLWIFVPAYAASVVAFFVCARFRVPLLAPLSILAAHGAWTLVDLVRERRFARAAGASALVAAAVAAVETLPRGVDTSWSNGLWHLGVIARQAGDLETAVEHFEAAIDENPRKLYPQRDLGSTLTALRRFDDAERHLRIALELAPRDVATLRARTELALARGDLEVADERARAARALVPTSSVAALDVGRVTYARASAARDREDLARATALALDAVRAFDDAYRLAAHADEAFDAAFSAGASLSLAERWEDALARYEQALARRPVPDADGWYWQAQIGRLRALSQSGGAARADTLARELLREPPSDPRIVAALRAFFAPR